MIRRSAAGVFQLWLSLLACISHALSATSVVLINDDNSEVMALWAIRQALQDPQNALATWDKNYISPCTFAYIQCSAEQVVIRVDLPNEQLGGSLSPHFAGLPNLQYLMLQNNNISGPIPWELGNLTQLISLDLSNNNLTGSIPNTLRNLKSLTYLNLNNNKLTGGFPVFLSSITGLSIL
jgi:somatic embryogenesis receptor kinase 1